jgi:DNA-binding transcriptional ArsR family regulator
MGVTRSEIFTKDQNQISAMAKSLGHPARVAILQHLTKQHACICSDLVDVVGLAQPTISQHLKELKKVGLIKGTIEGTSVCYCINQSVWDQTREMFANIFKWSTKSCGNCC